jgi:hypothetical protein
VKKGAGEIGHRLGLQGRNVFKSPQGCSRTHPVDKDESSRPVRQRALDVRETPRWLEAIEVITHIAEQ